MPFEDFLVGELVPVFWWVWQISSLEGSAMSSTMFCGICGLVMTWGILSANG